MKKIKLYIIGLMMMVPMASNAASAMFGVTFGVAQSNGGDCVGKGVCKDKLSGDDEFIHVTILQLPSEPGIVKMRFPLVELANKQPGQVENFTSGSYAFDANYTIPSNVCTALGIPEGSMIMSGIAYVVQINQGMVTVTMPYVGN